MLLLGLLSPFGAAQRAKGLGPQRRLTERVGGFHTSIGTERRPDGCLNRPPLAFCTARVQNQRSGSADKPCGDRRRAGLIASAGGWLLLVLLGCQAPQPIPQLKCIHLTGMEHQWQAEYELHSGDNLDALAPDLHVPVGQAVELILTSKDYIYTMAIPEFRVKEIAVPDLEFRISIYPLHCGEFPLIGQELCGVPGQAGRGRLIVESPAEFNAWFARQRQTAKRHTRASAALR